VSFPLLLTLTSPTHADIYKYVDPDGRVTYSSIPIRGAKKLDLGPAFKPSPHTTNRPQTSPADFPKVDTTTQKTRDNARRDILQNEMAQEEKLLQETRRSLSEAQARNESSEKTKALRDEITLHEKNLDALKIELKR
jgi:hypothetical protein